MSYKRFEINDAITMASEDLIATTEVIRSYDNVIKKAITRGQATAQLRFDHALFPSGVDSRNKGSYRYGF